MSILKVDAIQSRGSSDSAITFSGGLLLPRSVIMQVKASDTDQAYTAGSDAKVEWESVEVDTISGWDSTNHRYTPSVAGYYMFGGNIRISAPTTNQYVMVKVLKNGDDSSRHTIQLNHSSDILTNGSYPIPSGIMQLNGSSDYIEVFVGGDENMTIHDNATTGSFFFAKLVHAT